MDPVGAVPLEAIGPVLDKFERIILGMVFVSGTGKARIILSSQALPL